MTPISERERSAILDVLRTLMDRSLLTPLDLWLVALARLASRQDELVIAFSDALIDVATPGRT